MVADLAAAADTGRSLTLTEAADALNLKPESSWLNLRLAALKKYGLLEDLPAGETRERRLRLTYSAMTLDSLAPGKPLHKVLRHQAALMPPIYNDLWERFGPVLPSNAPMREYLVKERQFNPQSVDALLDNFRSTVEYAGLVEQALSFRELAEAIAADESQKTSPRKSRLSLAMEQMKTMNREAEAAAAGPIIGETLLNLSAAQLRAQVEQVEAATGRRTTIIPLDGNEDTMLQFPREMTAQRWQTIIDTLELWKKQAQSSEGA